MVAGEATDRERSDNTMATQKPHPKATVAIGYARVSTDSQVKAGVSLEAQEAAIRAHCLARGLTLDRILIEPGVSAAKVPLKDRPEGGKLVAAIARGEVGVVVVMKLDRAFRNAIETLVAVEDWEKRSVALHLLDLGGMSVDTSTAMGKMFLTMLAGLAEMERNVTSERTCSALAHKKAIGELTGTAPLGMRAVPSARTKTTRDGQVRHVMILTEDPQEQAAFARIRDLDRSGLSLRQIAAVLTSEGYKPRGKEWQYKTISRVLARSEGVTA